MAAREKRSKKRSDTKHSPEKRLEPFVFFVDWSLGKNTVPEMLIEAELHTERHADHFPDDAPDVLWLLRCGEEEWVVLAKDKSIRSNEMERQALFNAGVAAFLLTSANTTGEENGIRKVFVLRFPVSLGMMQSLIRNVR
ncbi:MAG: hypothetical protein ACREEM_00745 [Blastocatellia bacterium]